MISIITIDGNNIVSNDICDDKVITFELKKKNYFLTKEICHTRAKIRNGYSKKKGRIRKRMTHFANIIV